MRCRAGKAKPARADADRHEHAAGQGRRGDADWTPLCFPLSVPARSSHLHLVQHHAADEGAVLTDARREDHSVNLRAGECGGCSGEGRAAGASVDLPARAWCAAGWGGVGWKGAGCSRGPTTLRRICWVTTARPRASAPVLARARETAPL